MASSRTGSATGSVSSSIDARAAKALLVRDRVCVAIGSAERVVLMRRDRRCTVVQPALSTLRGAAWGSPLGGGAGGDAVGGVLLCLTVGASEIGTVVECRSVRRASMAASRS